MLVSLRNIHCEISGILNIIVAIGSQAHQISATAAALNHVADSLFVKLALSQHTDNQSTVLNQADSTMLQFAGSISLTVDIGNFLHLQAALQADSIIQTTADKEDILSVNLFSCKPLDTFLIFNNLLDFIRQLCHFLNQLQIFSFVNSTANNSKLNCQAVSSNQLSAVSLGSCNGNFRACQSIENIICFTGNRAAYYVNDAKSFDALFFSQTQCCQAVSGFARLADNDNQLVLAQQRLAVSELRSQLGTNRNLCQILNYILRCHTYMVSTAAGNYADLVNLFNILVAEADSAHIQLAVNQYGIQSIAYCLGLLVDFLHHEMLKACFFGSFGVPFDFGQRFFDYFLINVVEGNLAVSQTSHFQIAYVIYLTGVFQNSRHVAGNIAFAVLYADDHRAVLTGNINFTGIFLEHYCQSIGAAHTDHGMAQSIGRSMLVLFIVVVNQFNGNLGISLRIEGITVMQQLFLQLLIVFDNTVVYGNYIAISTCMRMRISFGRLAMGCPSGMTDTAGTDEALTTVSLGVKLLQTALGLYNLHLCTAIAHCEAGRIVTTIFKLRQTI